MPFNISFSVAGESLSFLLVQILMKDDCTSLKHCSSVNLDYCY